MVAVFSAALVVALGLLTVSPQAHAWLHGKASLTEGSPAAGSPLADASDHEDDGCVVHLYAHGGACEFTIVTVKPAVIQWTEDYVLIERRLSLPQTRYLRRPERGPPSFV